MTDGEIPAELVADEIVTQTLLRCWVRETGVQLPAGARALEIDLPASGQSVRAMLTHHSPSGWHGFGPPHLVRPGGEPAPVDAGLLAALLVREIAAQDGFPPSLGVPALGRIIDSADRIAGYIRGRRQAADLADVPPFLAAEQDLITGHPFHPAAKSRPGASESALAAYSPECHGSFALHWFAAHPSVVTVAGTAATSHVPSPATVAGPVGPGVAQVLAALAGEPSDAGQPAGVTGQDTDRSDRSDRSGRGTGRGAGRHGPLGLGRAVGVDRTGVPTGYVLVPAHPWQAQEVRGQGRIADLIADGRLIDLGVCGAHWYPTSSLRTVWRPDAPIMLKLSLGMRITNSRRVLHLGELRLGTMIARLVDAGVGAALRARHPDFHLIGEPGWVAVTRPGPAGRSLAGSAPSGASRPGAGPGAQRGGEEGVGLESAIRVNPFGPADRVVCGAALIAPRPDRAWDGQGSAMAAMLPQIVMRLASARHEPVPAVVGAWFGRYLTMVAAPVVDLYLHFGIGVEAHLQNVLVSLDEQGWPRAGWYRDSQGYYIAVSGAGEAERLVPGFAAGLDAVFEDTLVAERIIYYLFVNNVFALAGALGAAGLADERRLLGQVRRLLLRLGGKDSPSVDGPDRPSIVRRALLATLLDCPTLPCKANLRTCVDGRDELVGPVSTQSVYVQIPNPLVEAAP